MSVLNRFHRVALRCGAIPLLLGSGIFLFWLMTNWALLVFAGLATLIIGIPTVLIGLVALAHSCRLALRDSTVSRRRVWRSALAGAGLLLVNVPVAAGIIATVMTITARYSVVVYSEVRLDDVRVVGCGCDVAYGTLLPGATARHSFPIRQRGDLRFHAVGANSGLDETIEPYLSSGSGGHLQVTVERDQRIVVDRRARTFEMFQRVLEMFFELERWPCADRERSSSAGTPPPPELVVVESAQDVRVHAQPGGGVLVAYRLREPFPAEPVVARIRAALPATAWTPLTEDWLNPGTPAGNARRWRESVDTGEKPSPRVHVWTSEWKDATGNLVLYSLTYRSPLLATGRSASPPDNSTLIISATWFPASAVRMLREGLEPGR